MDAIDDDAHHMEDVDDNYQWIKGYFYIQNIINIIYSPIKYSKIRVNSTARIQRDDNKPFCFWYSRFCRTRCKFQKHQVGLKSFKTY